MFFVEIWIPIRYQNTNSERDSLVGFLMIGLDCVGSVNVAFLDQPGKVGRHSSQHLHVRWGEDNFQLDVLDMTMLRDSLCLQYLLCRFRENQLNQSQGSGVSSGGNHLSYPPLVEKNTMWCQYEGKLVCFMGLVFHKLLYEIDTHYHLGCASEYC